MVEAETYLKIEIDIDRYPHVTLAFDDLKRFSAHKGPRNPTIMTYS